MQEAVYAAKEGTEREVFTGKTGVDLITETGINTQEE